MRSRHRIPWILHVVVCAGAMFLPAVLPAHGAPVARLTWGVGSYRGCLPASSDLPATPGSLLPAFVTVVGHEAAHKDWRLELDLYPADGGAYPDAWRVDSLGCAYGGMAMYFVPPPIPETCLDGFYPVPTFSLIAPRTAMRFDSSANRLRLSIWVGIEPAHVDPNPSRVYLLGTFVFGHERSVVGAGDETSACGGVERPFCLRLVEASYLDAAGTWVPWTIDPSVISANGGAGPSCTTVAALPATWGAIKAQYR